MDCYIINCSKKTDPTFKNGTQRLLDHDEMQNALKVGNNLAKKLEETGKKRVKVYSSDSNAASHFCSIIIPRLIANNLCTENDVEISGLFNDRNYGEISAYSREDISPIKVFGNKASSQILRANLNMKNEYGIETKKDYKNRVFDAVSKIVFENQKDDAVILVVGNEFISTCQKDESVHSMIYFGDEKYYVPRTTRSSFDCNSFDPTSLMNDSFVNLFSMQSTKQFPELKPERVLLEKPGVNSYGDVTPIYEKYAKAVAVKQIEKESEMMKNNQMQ